MMNLLHSFASLSLISGLLLTLLPEGSVRRTASMVVGLLMLLMWSDGLTALLDVPESSAPPAAVLSPTGASLDDSTLSAQAAITSIWEGTP